MNMKKVIIKYLKIGMIGSALLLALTFLLDQTTYACPVYIYNPSSYIDQFTLDNDSTDYEGGIRYRTHTENGNWTDWKYDDPLSIFSDECPYESIELELYGEVSKYYDLSYRTYSNGFGWTGWTTRGISGTIDQGFRLKALQVKYIKKTGFNHWGLYRLGWRSFTPWYRDYPIRLDDILKTPTMGLE